MNKIKVALINSSLAGILVLLGSCTGGFPSAESLFIAFIASAIVAVTQFGNFFKTISKSKKAELRILNFIAL